jgi:YfiH family protein
MITYHTLKAKKNDLFAEIPLFPPYEKYKQFPLKAIITLKRAGDMGYDVKDTSQNRSALFNYLGMSAENIFTVNQGHTKDIIHLKEKQTPDVCDGRTADGFITALCGPIMGITVADCVPILIFNNNGLLYSILHSGWKGTGIIENALEVFQEKYHIRPNSLRVCMGPAIGPCCYRVTHERAAYFAARFGKNTIAVKKNEYYLDLMKANINLVQKWGVEDIIVMTDCTCCNPVLSSFRRDGKKGLSRMLVLLGPFSLPKKESECSSTE